MARNRAYCFTVNNPTADDEADVKALSELASYMVVGREKGEQEETPHLQGYVYFKDAKTFTSVKKKLRRAHIEAAVACAETNRKYCTKGGDIMMEVGVPPKAGARTDLEKVREALKGGSNMRGIVETAKSMQSVKMAEVWLKYNEKERDWKPEVRWYHGSTGSGKTRAAREWLADDVYTCMNDGKWFEGYDGHENVLIDDFRKDFCKFHVLLKMLDRYGYKVETKGGSRQFLARKIAITAPYPPDVIYDTREDVKQLLRRIDQVIQIGSRVKTCKIEYEDGEELFSAYK